MSPTSFLINNPSMNGNLSDGTHGYNLKVYCINKNVFQQCSFHIILFYLLHEQPLTAKPDYPFMC